MKKIKFKDNETRLDSKLFEDMQNNTEEIEKELKEEIFKIKLSIFLEILAIIGLLILTINK